MPTATRGGDSDHSIFVSRSEGEEGAEPWCLHVVPEDSTVGYITSPLREQI